jgi:hypothetical protein
MTFIYASIPGHEAAETPPIPIVELRQEIFIGFGNVTIIEVIFRPAFAAEGRTVSQFLDIVQSAGDTLASVCVEGIKID